MVMRNRRIRLLVLAIVITIIFFAYSSSDPTTIEGAKQYAQRTYQSALDQTLGSKKSSSDTSAPVVEIKKDDPFRVDFEAYNKADGIEPNDPTKPPPAQPVPQPPKEDKPAVEKIEPKKDDPMRVDFEHYSKVAAAGSAESSSPASNEVVANPNPVVGVVGAKETSSVAAAKPTAAAKAEPVGAPNVPPIGAPKVPPIGKPKDQVSPIAGEGRVEIDVDNPSVGDSVHWKKLAERFAPTSTIAFPFNSGSPIPKIQFDFSKTSVKADTDKLAAIKAAAEHTWKGYKEQAMGHDEPHPISGKYTNPFNGWGATLVDSLDTLWLMGMIPEFEDALTYVKKIDFTHSKRADIPLFETTIRYMGGLLGAYEISSRHYTVLLDQAKQLGEILYGAFDTPNRMPMTYYQWKPAFASQGHRASAHAVMAEVGSLSLEFTRLGQLVGDTKYYDAIARITNALEEWQPKTRIPGLWPTVLDASGCKKLPSTDVDMRKFSESKGPTDPLPKYPEPVKSTPADERVMKSSVGGKEPGLGHIAGFGAPYEEGSLDTKAAKDSLLSNGLRTVKRAFDAVKEEVGAKLHDIAESEPVKQVGATLHNIAESEPVKQVQAGLHDIASSAPVKAVSDSLSNSAAAGINKQEARSSSQIPLDDEDSCIPQGLVSETELGADIFTFGAAADSTYEYLPKMHLLLGGRVDQYENMYKKAIAAAKKTLLYRAMIPDEKREVLFVGNMDVKPNLEDPTKMESVFSAGASHLTCFVGGMFAMAGKIFNSPEDVAIGAKLTDGCIWAYNSTATGIMPELFGLYKCDSMERCKWDEAAYYQALDPFPSQRLSKTKAPTSDPRAILNSGSKAGQASKNSPNDLRKRQFGGGEMQYGVNTAPEILPGAAAAVVAEVPPYAIGQQGAPPSTPLGDPAAIKNPFEAGAAPRLPAEGVPKAGDAKGAPFPAAPDANARPASDKPAEPKPLGVPASDKPVEPKPLGAPAANKLPPVTPDTPIAPTVPDTQSGMLSDKKVAPAVPDTGLAPVVPDTGAKLSSGSRFGSDRTPNSPVKLAPGVESVPEYRPLHKEPALADGSAAEALSHKEYVEHKIKTERLPAGMVGLYNKKYILRPEAIESVFYMWRITGDQYWRDRGWEMWQAVHTATAAPYGATAIEDVTKIRSTPHDSQESFWLAETLKYFYLLFDDPERYSLDDWVLNTEAHFLSRLGA